MLKVTERSYLNPRGRDYLGFSIRFTTGFLLAIPLKSDYCRKITWITLKLIIKRNPPLHMLMLFELKDRDKRLKENDSMTSIGLSIEFDFFLYWYLIILTQPTLFIKLVCIDLSRNESAEFVCCNKVNFISNYPFSV